ncbi:MAG: hypothetical protein R2725_15880 [Solirubrobacterales bacterium]
MKRLFVAALAAALVLVVSVGGVAVAAGDGARGSAKSKTGKKRSCKKKSKNKKGKKRGCKKKSGSNWPLNGYYEGREGIALSVAGRGRKAELVYSPTNAKTCVEHSSIGFPAASVTSSAASLSAEGEGTLPNGQYGWSITVNRDLTYRATISSSSVNPFAGPCDRPGVAFNGKLKKVH